MRRFRYIAPLLSWILPCQKEVKASHGGIVPLRRKLLTIAVELTIVGNAEHLNCYLNRILLYQPHVDASS